MIFSTRSRAISWKLLNDETIKTVRRVCRFYEIWKRDQAWKELIKWKRRLSILQRFLSDYAKLRKDIRKGYIIAFRMIQKFGEACGMLQPCAMSKNFAGKVVHMEGVEKFIILPPRIDQMTLALRLIKGQMVNWFQKKVPSGLQILRYTKQMIFQIEATACSCSFIEVWQKFSLFSCKTNH